MQAKMNSLKSNQVSGDSANDFRSDLRNFMSEIKSQRVNESAKQSQESIVIQEKLESDQLKVVFKRIDDLKEEFDSKLTS